MTHLGATSRKSETGGGGWVYCVMHLGAASRKSETGGGGWV